MNKIKENLSLIIVSVATLIYLLFIFKLTNLDEISNLKLNEIGDYLAGVFAPLAFLWLVFGYYQQGQELKQNTEALRLQAEELKNSVEQQILLNTLRIEEQNSRHFNVQPLLNIMASDSYKEICEIPKHERIDEDDEYYEFWYYDLRIKNNGTSFVKFITLYKNNEIKSLNYPLQLLKPNEDHIIRVSLSETEITELTSRDLTHKFKILFLDELGKTYVREFECTIHPINPFDDDHFTTCDYNIIYAHPQ
ncbi:hypothetical protein [Acinetobacter soli]|uniref:hypothetical protein n=1 Tax=Acinetobacter soli TaxID=487316 RepID=UPI0012315149|nr:hypothetical protein [Acinetobacter soli]